MKSRVSMASLATAATLAVFASSLGALVEVGGAFAPAAAPWRQEVLPARIDAPARLQLAVAPRPPQPAPMA
jgi:hypothetical protein